MLVTDVDLRDAAIVNFLVDPGYSWNTTLTLELNGIAINITGATATMKIKKNFSDTAFVQSLSIGSGLSITGVGSNILSISPAPLVAGEFYHEIIITKTNGDVFRIKGRVISK